MWSIRSAFATMNNMNLIYRNVAIFFFANFVLTVFGQENFKIAINYRYDVDSSGLSKVKIGNKWGFIDKKGEAIMNFLFDDVKDFHSNGLACVEKGINGIVIIISLAINTLTLCIEIILQTIY